MATVDPLAYGILHCFTHLTGEISGDEFRPSFGRKVVWDDAKSPE